MPSRRRPKVPSLPAKEVMSSVREYVASDVKSRLDTRIAESKFALKHVLDKGITSWQIAYSGGKDSSTAVALTLELVRSGELAPDSIDITYADTCLEIPILRANALQFLDYVTEIARDEALPVKCHVVTPRVEERFWFLLLGKGYPPPHQRFRWCTRRLKITPARELLRYNGAPENTCILTGVRFRESKARDKQMELSCRRGGECGQGLWFWQSKSLGISFVAPIVHWKSCDVWDYLRFVLPLAGWPTLRLYEIYCNDNEMRFGCWMCTVVRQDRTMTKLTEANNLNYLKPLLEFRNYTAEVTNCRLHPESRIMRPDGNPGRLSMNTRKMLFDRLLDVEEKSGLTLIIEEEKAAITQYWSEYQNLSLCDPTTSMVQCVVAK